MRLLYTRTQYPELHEFIANDKIPKYAILSHTWGSDEVKFEELSDPASRRKRGYQKILWCCRQAAKDNIDWAWVDTCCIDKRSSAELSEAINSMYTWYNKSVICYAFLEDVGAPAPRVSRQEFKNSRWFTRGWTLQELLAPKKVEFYSQGWVAFGDRTGLADFITDITGIERRFLLVDQSLASAAKKMSWAAHRQTSRTEDIAYCLMGLFDVNMPLLYGEGEKAFIRLQEEISKVTGDNSLFAWGQPYELGPHLDPPRRSNRWARGSRRDDNTSYDSFDEELIFSDEDVYGLFADHPRDFRNSGNVDMLINFQGLGIPPVLYGKGVRIGLPIIPGNFTEKEMKRIPWLRKASVALLASRIDGDNSRYVALLLRPWGKRFYGRATNPIIIKSTREMRDAGELEKLVQNVVIKKPDMIEVTPPED